MNVYEFPPKLSWTTQQFLFTAQVPHDLLTFEVLLCLLSSCRSADTAQTKAALLLYQTSTLPLMLLLLLMYCSVSEQHSIYPSALIPQGRGRVSQRMRESPCCAE